MVKIQSIFNELTLLIIFLICSVEFKLAPETVGRYSEYCSRLHSF
jgi:hypothetical protein